MLGAIPPPPNTSAYRGAQLKHRDNLYFNFTNVFSTKVILEILSLFQVLPFFSWRSKCFYVTENVRRSVTPLGPYLPTNHYVQDDKGNQKTWIYIHWSKRSKPTTPVFEWLWLGLWHHDDPNLSIPTSITYTYRRGFPLWTLSHFRRIY